MFGSLVGQSPPSQSGKTSQAFKARMKDKRIIIVLGIFVILFILIEFLGMYVLEGLQIIFQSTGRMAQLSIGTAEFSILGFLPLINYLLLKQKNQPSLRKLIVQNLIVLILIFGSVGTGILIMCIYDFNPSPLLPDYLVSQPFKLYWAMFIFAGILLGYGLIRNKPERINSF